MENTVSFYVFAIALSVNFMMELSFVYNEQALFPCEPSRLLLQYGVVTKHNSFYRQKAAYAICLSWEANENC